MQPEWGRGLNISATHNSVEWNLLTAKAASARSCASSEPRVIDRELLGVRAGSLVNFG